jgi:hypothetical protein
MKNIMGYHFLVLISEFEWKRINNIDFNGRFKYDPDEDKIPPNVMKHLEEKKRVWSPFPLSFLNSKGERTLVIDNFIEDAKTFFTSQQDIFFFHPNPSTLVKVNYLYLSIQSSKDGKFESTMIDSAESFVRCVYKDYFKNSIDSVDESKLILSFNSYNWFFVMMIINKHGNLF